MHTLRNAVGAAVIASCVAAASAGSALAAGHSLLRPATATQSTSSAPATRPAERVAAGHPVSVTFGAASLDRPQTGVTLRFWAPSGDPCLGTGERSFTAEVTFSGRAGTVVMLEHYAGPPAILPPGAHCMRTLTAQPYQIQVVLSAPLGSRSLATPDRHPIAVTRT